MFPGQGWARPRRNCCGCHVQWHLLGLPGLGQGHPILKSTACLLPMSQQQQSERCIGNMVWLLTAWDRKQAGWRKSRAIWEVLKVAYIVSLISVPLLAFYNHYVHQLTLTFIFSQKSPLLAYLHLFVPHMETYHCCSVAHGGKPFPRCSVASAAAAEAHQWERLHPFLITQALFFLPWLPNSSLTLFSWLLRQQKGGLKTEWERVHIGFGSTLMSFQGNTVMENLKELWMNTKWSQNNPDI